MKNASVTASGPRCLVAHALTAWQRTGAGRRRAPRRGPSGTCVVSGGAELLDLDGGARRLELVRVWVVVVLRDPLLDRRGRGVGDVLRPLEPQAGGGPDHLDHRDL